MIYFESYVVKFKFSRVKVYVVVRDRIGNGCRLYVLCDLNWRKGETGCNWCFWISGKNYNGGRIVVFCGERGLCVITYASNRRVCISTQGW